MTASERRGSPEHPAADTDPQPQPRSRRRALPNRSPQLFSWTGDVDHWVVRALCRQVDPDLFYPEKGQLARQAKRICADCPVRQQCLDAALARDERFGVWGGMSTRERDQLRRQRRRSAPVPIPA